MAVSYIVKECCNTTIDIFTKYVFEIPNLWKGGMKFPKNLSNVRITRMP